MQLIIRSLLFSILLVAPIQAQQTSALSPLGVYSNIRQDAEHCSGYEVDLWRAGTRVYGVFRACAGTVGDQKSVQMENAVYDRRTGKLTFQAKLSVGSDFLKGGQQVDSQDVYTFAGRLLASRIRGSLQHQDLIYKDRAVATDRVELRKQTTVLPEYGSVDAWKSGAR